MIVKFTIPGPPQGKARAKVYHNPKTNITRGVTPEKTVLYENLIKTCYQSEGKHNFGESPLIMTIEAYYGIPKSVSKKKVATMISQVIRPTKKPDIDNLTKIVADALNGIAYKDDSQIVELSVVKFYGEIPRVEVLLEEL